MSTPNSQILDSNEFWSNLSLPPRIYGPGTEPPDNHKVIIQHSNMDYVSKVANILGEKEFAQIEISHIGSIVKLARRSSVHFSEDLFHFIMQRRIMTKGEGLWFTFSDQPMRFSMREFQLTTGLACEEDKTKTEPMFRELRKPFPWMLTKGDKYTVSTLFDRLEKKGRSMSRLERLCIGIAIITEGVILAEHPSSLIPKTRMMAYQHYDRFSKMAWGKLAYSVLLNSLRRLGASSWTGESYEVSGFVIAINMWALSSVPKLGKSLGKPCQETSSSGPLCLHWQSTKSISISELLELERKNNGVVTTVIGFPEEFKHLVNPTHPDDTDFDSIVQLVQQGYKLKKSDWEQGFVDIFLTTEELGRQSRAEDIDVQHNSKEQTQDEEEQPVEADAELGDVDKERETSKVNEGQTLEKEEEEQMEADAGLEDPLYKTQDDEEPQVGADGEFNEGQTLEKEEEEEQMEADSGLEDHLYKEQTQDDEEPQVGTDGEFNEGQTLEKEEDKQMEADAGLEDPLYKTQDDEEPHVGAEGEFNEGQTLEKEEEEQMEGDSALEDHLYKEQTQDDEEFNEGQTLEEEEDKQIEADAGLEDPVVVERQEERRGNKEQTQDDEEPHVGADGEFNEGKTLEEEKEQMEADARLEYPVVVERQKEGRRNKEQKKSGEKRKDEAHEKDKEKNQDEDVSMTNSEKLDKLLQMVYDLGKRVEVIQNVLGVKVPDGSSNKQDYEKSANFFDDTKGAPNDENEEEANPGDKRNAADDGNDEEIIDKEAISATQQLTEVNTIGENEITEKITQDEETEKMENESFKKQKSQVTSSSQTFTTPNFDTRVTSPTPTYTTPKFDLLSQESRSSVKCATEVLMRDVGEKSEFQPLMKTKKRSVQQDNQVNDDAELPVKKKNKGDIGDVALRRSERGQIPSIHTQPPFTGARKKHPIIHPFEPVDKTRKEKMTEWKMSNKNKKHTLIINNVRVNSKWFSDLETPGRKLLKTHIEAGLELLKTRKRNNPDLFLNKTALVVGVKFLEEIDELYDEFLDDKEGFQFESGFGKYNIEKNISVLYSAIEIEEKYWLGIVVNLEKRSVTAFNSAAVKFTDGNIRAYVNAYAIVLPFMLRNIFKDVNVDTSKFDIYVVSEDYPQVLKIEDSGVYALKLIECHAMRIVDFTKMSEEKIAFIREKLAVDIFSELQ